MSAKRTTQSTAKALLAARVAAVVANATTQIPPKYESICDSGNTGQRAPRELKYAQGVLRLEFGERLAVTLKDLSGSGARVEFYRRVTLSDEVVLSVPPVLSNVKARVIWQDQGAAGLKFDEHQNI